MADELNPAGAQESTPAPVSTSTPAAPAAPATTFPSDGGAGGDSTTTATPADPNAAPAEENPYLLQLDDEDAPQQGDPTKPNADPGEALKPFFSVSPYVNSPETLQGAIADSHMLWDVVNGQKPPGTILDGVKASNPQAFQGIVNGLAQYISELTGYSFVDPKNLPKGAEVVDPVQERMQGLERQFQEQERKRADEVLTFRANQAQRVVVSHLTEALKGTFLEGDEGLALSLLGSKLGKPEAIIDAVEKGDFKSIDAALKQVKRDEAERYNRYATRIQAQRKAKASSLPAVDNPGSPAAPRKGKYDLSTREGRIAFANTV